MGVTIKGPKNPKREGLALVLGILIGIFAILAYQHSRAPSIAQPAEPPAAGLR